MASTGEAGRSGRRPELDGVRGIAILLVVVGHAGVPYGLGPLGAAGLTVFFALSGYLITGILLAERQRTGRVDLRRFYWRRLTRLGPPLWVMLAGITIWAGGLPWESLVMPATWTTNFWWLTGLDPHPFHHTSTLGVEEQFYLLWPFALAGLTLTRRPVLWLGVGVLALMAWRSVLLADGQGLYAYAAFETAGSAILAGCLVRVAQWRLSGSWAALATLALVAVGLLFGQAGGDGWYSVPLLVTPVAAALVAAAGSAPWLAWKPLAWCGLVSYSVYLWHEPVMWVSAGGWSTVGVLAGAATGVVAYYLVEQPVMRWRASRSGKRVDLHHGRPGYASAARIEAPGRTRV